MASNLHSNNSNKLNILNRETLSALNGIKGVSALMIVIYHYGHFLPPVYPYDQYLKTIYVYGHYFVDLFFIMSGLLFFGISLPRIQTQRRSSEVSGDFIVHKYHKLFPLFFLTTGVVALFQWILLYLTGEAFIHPADLYSLFLNIIGMQHVGLGRELAFNGPAWYLSVLMVCYYIYIYICRQINFGTLQIVVAIGVALFRINSGIPFLQQQVARGIVGFSMGGIIYFVAESSISKKRISACSFAVLAMSILLPAIFQQRGIDIVGEKQLYYMLVVWPALLAICLTTEIIQRVLSARLFKCLGDLSYSVFLWQFPIEVIMVFFSRCLKQNIDFSANSVWWIRLSATYGIAWLSNCYLEPWFSRERMTLSN